MLIKTCSFVVLFPPTFRHPSPERFRRRGRCRASPGPRRRELKVTNSGLREASRWFDVEAVLAWQICWAPSRNPPPSLSTERVAGEPDYAGALPFPEPRFGSGRHHSPDLDQAQLRSGGDRRASWMTDCSSL